MHAIATQSKSLFEGKLHSKIIIFDHIGLFSTRPVVRKVRGQNLNRNTVEQTAKNGQKFLGDDGAADITSLAPGVKNSRLRNGLEFHRAQ